MKFRVTHTSDYRVNHTSRTSIEGEELLVDYPTGLLFDDNEVAYGLDVQDLSGLLGLIKKTGYQDAVITLGFEDEKFGTVPPTLEIYDDYRE